MSTDLAIISPVETFLRNQLEPRTHSAYGLALRKYTEWVVAGPGTLQVDLEQALEYRDRLVAEYAASTAALHVSAIRALYRTLKATGLIALNVWEVVKGPQAYNTVSATKAITPDQVQELFVKASRPADRLMLRLLYEVGLRREEVATLKREALEDHGAEGWAIRVTGKGNKTALVGISNDLADDLRKCGPGFLFPGRAGGHISLRQVNNIVGKLGVGPHQLRHSHATHALHRGVPLQDVSRTLRHTDVRTTMRYFSTADQIKRSSARVLGG